MSTRPISATRILMKLVVDGEACEGSSCGLGPIFSSPAVHRGAILRIYQFDDSWCEESFACDANKPDERLSLLPLQFLCLVPSF